MLRWILLAANSCVHSLGHLGGRIHTVIRAVAARVHRTRPQNSTENDPEDMQRVLRNEDDVKYGLRVWTASHPTLDGETCRVKYKSVWDPCLCANLVWARFLHKNTGETVLCGECVMFKEPVSHAWHRARKRHMRKADPPRTVRDHSSDERVIGTACGTQTCRTSRNVLQARDGQICADCHDWPTRKVRKWDDSDHPCE